MRLAARVSALEALYVRCAIQIDTFTFFLLPSLTFFYLFNPTSTTSCTAPQISTFLSVQLDGWTESVYKLQVSGGSQEASWRTYSGTRFNDQAQSTQRSRWSAHCQDLRQVSLQACWLFIRIHCVSKTSNLSKAHETRDSLSSSCSHIVLVYLQPFHRNSPLKCALQPKTAKKITNTH